VGGLVVFLGDDRADAATAQQRPVGAGAVSLVGQHPIRPGPGPSRAPARHPDAAQHRRELGAVPTLAGGQHDRQGALALLDGQVELGRQPTSGAAERVILGLVVDSAWFFALPIPPICAGIPGQWAIPLL
jgi:hypothetical protein